ncbi:MAG: hypothetical protein IJ597_08070 [Synergistaceae bacterium]|nr:hypothetical protein [Synergistaceae bacterium]
MTKAKSLDRLELTHQKMQARERIKANAQVVRPREFMPPEIPETDEEAKANSPFVKMREELIREHPELLDEEHSCPVCGGELVRYEGCYRCKKCGWSKC